MNNIIKTGTKQVNVSGKGKNRQEAFADALTKVSKKITSDKEKLIFKIEPESFKVKSLTKINEKEHFLFIFFPRTVVSYQVDMIVNVNLEYISLNKLPAEEIEITDNQKMIKNVKGV